LTDIHLLFLWGIYLQLQVLQWLPVSHKDDIMPDTAKEKQEVKFTF